METTYEIIKTHDDHDSDDVVMHGKFKGFGYKGKKDGKIGLIRCPECGQENYSLAVAKGQCCWCGFKANL